MSRRPPRYPPPPDGIERRQAFRREDDMETHDVAEATVDSVSFIRRVKRSGEALVLGVALGGVVTGTATALGTRIVGPHQDITQLGLRVDENAAKIVTQRRQFDSLLTVIAGLKDELHDVKRDMSTLTNLSCISAAKTSPDVARAGGCSNR